MKNRFFLFRKRRRLRLGLQHGQTIGSERVERFLKRQDPDHRVDPSAYSARVVWTCAHRFCYQSVALRAYEYPKHDNRMRACFQNSETCSRAVTRNTANSATISEPSAGSTPLRKSFKSLVGQTTRLR